MFIGLDLFHYGDDLLNLLRTISLFIVTNCLHLDCVDPDSVGLTVGCCFYDMLNDVYVVFSSCLAISLLLHLLLLDRLAFRK